MAKDFGAEQTIVPAQTASRIAITRIEVHTPVHNTAGENTMQEEVIDSNGVLPGGENYERTLEDVVVASWDALDPTGSEKDPDARNSHRTFYVDYMDENGEGHRVSGVTIQQLIDAGVDYDLLTNAHSALKALAYSDSVVNFAGLPSGGTVS
jgi:hypothetical protein